MLNQSPSQKNQDFGSREHEEFVQNLLAFFIAIGLLLGFGFLLHIFYHPHEAPIDEVRALFLKPDYVEPEVKERTQFLAFILLLLPISLIAIWIVQKKSEVWLAQIFYRENSARSKLWYATTFSLPLLMTIPFVGSHFFEIIIPHRWANYWGLTPLIVLPLTIWLFFKVFSQSRSLRQQRRHAHLIAVILCLEIFVSVLFFRVFNLSMVSESPQWTFHFEAVFYTVAQVLGGQTLLADLPASYGLYAEILRPILILTGASVLAFTLIMACLQLIALLGLLWVCFRLIKLNEFRFICMTTLCLLIGGTWMIFTSGSLDPYFQYWPIRFFFPAVAVPLFFYFVRSETFFSVFILALFCVIGIVWNMDSGVPVAGAFSAFLLLQIFFAKDRQLRVSRLMRLFAFEAIIVAGLFAAFSYLQWKSGQNIALSEVTKYQQLFYKSGYYMMPMPRSPHPWMVVLGFYSFGIIGALYSLMRGYQSMMWKNIFFLSVLGLGLFPYYQGRSHEIVFTMVIWPAILIAFIFADRSLRAVQAKLFPRPFVWILIPITLLGVITSSIFIGGLPIAVEAETRSRGSLLFEKRSIPITENIDFIRSAVHGAQKAIILAPHQALYFAATGLVSSLKGPGLVETILVADQQDMLNKLTTTPVDHLFIQADANLKVPPVYDVLLPHYIVQQTNKNALLYLVPKKPFITNELKN